MEATSDINPDKVCRTCMAESSNMRSLFHLDDDGDQMPSDVLSFVTNMIVKREDKLPKHICNDCEVIMHQSSMFKRRCIDAETRFLKMLGIVNIEEDTTIFSKKPVVKSEYTHESHSSKLEQPYQCSICAFRFSDVQNLASHVKNLHCISENERSDHFQSSKDDVDVTHEARDSKHSIKEEIMETKDFLDNDFATDDFDFEHSLLDGVSSFHLKKDDDVFTCSTCLITFDTKSKFQEHIRDTHLTLSAIKKECQNNRKKSRKVNLEKPTDETKKFVCEHCNVKLKTRKSYQNHMRRKHREAQHKAPIKPKSAEENDVGTKHQCSLCMRKFVKKSTLAAHLKRHENPSSSHICSICKREFKHLAHLDNHILSVHTRQNGLKCDCCPKSFATKESLDLHKTLHQNEKKHQCSFCSKAFNMLSTLRDHLRVHTGEKPFLCPQCGKGFTQNTNLIEHLRRHQGIKPFKCDICERRFVSKGELAAHVRKHTGAHPFVCDDCGGGFTTSSSLVKHRRTHTGERPYACDLCNMKFAASGTLKNHRRTHTGEKPYKCSHCEKAFVQKNDLVAHTRCHTGERPYVCSTCGQAFRQGSALKAHLKMHQGKPGVVTRTGAI